MAHAQKPDFVFRRNERVHLNRRGASVQSTTGSQGVRISVSNAGYTMFRGSVKGTGYPLHSPVSLFTSRPVRHRVPSHFSWSLPHKQYSKTPLIRINWDGEPSGHAENPDNWIFLWKQATLVVLIGKRNLTSGYFRQHIYLRTNKTLMHNYL